MRTLPLISSPRQRSHTPLRQATGKEKPARWPASRMVSSSPQEKRPTPLTMMVCIGQPGSEAIDAVLAADQHHIRRASCKQAVGDHANQVVDVFLQLDRTIYLQVAHVDNHVAVIGDKALAQHWLAAKSGKFACHIGTRHRDHFHRQREGAEALHYLGVIDDTDKLARYRGDNFLALQRAAATLVHSAVRGTVLGV